MEFKNRELFIPRFLVHADWADSGRLIFLCGKLIGKDLVTKIEIGNNGLRRVNGQYDGLFKLLGFEYTGWVMRFL